jgi:hypothetical protein
VDSLLDLRRIVVPIAGLSSLLAQPLPAQGGFAVASVSPARNIVDAPTGTPVSISFTAPVDPSTVNAGTFRVFGRWSGVASGAHFVVAGGLIAHFQPARPFFPGEAVTVMLSSTVSGASGGNLAGGHTWSFWTRPAPGSGTLALAGTLDVRLPGDPPIRSYGAYAGDLDRDGAPDLSIPDENVSDVRVLLGNGCGGYALPVPHLLPSGSQPSANEGGDFDGDGFIDLAVANIASVSISVLRGNGAGGYLPAVIYPAGSAPRGVAVLDAEGDGDLDVVIANRNSWNLSLHLNAGNGTFPSASFFDGGGDGETGVVAVDANEDGIADLFVGNYDSQTATILLGNGAGGFALSGTIPLGGRPWMIAAGDVDGDGHVDVASANADTATGTVARGNGSGGFFAPATTVPTGSIPIAVDLGDLEGDGDLDLVLSNYGSGTFTIYRNDGAGAFVAPTTLPAISAGSCATFVDDDRDGDLDLLGIDELADKVLLYRQAGSSPPGVQAPSCAATLRIDNLANRAGYAGTLPHDVKIGGIFFVGVTGAPNVPYALAIGLPQEPGIPAPYGLENLTSWFFLFDGFAGSPNAFTDGFGEDTESILVPSTLSPGVSVAFQGFVLDATNPFGGTVTNPERVVLVP